MDYRCDNQEVFTSPFHFLLFSSREKDHSVPLTFLKLHSEPTATSFSKESTTSLLALCQRLTPSSSSASIHAFVIFICGAGSATTSTLFLICPTTTVDSAAVLSTFLLRQPFSAGESTRSGPFDGVSPWFLPGHVSTLTRLRCFFLLRPRKYKPKWLLRWKKHSAGFIINERTEFGSVCLQAAKTWVTVTTVLKWQSQAFAASYFLVEKRWCHIANPKPSGEIRSHLALHTVHVLLSATLQSTLLISDCSQCFIHSHVFYHEVVTQIYSTTLRVIPQKTKMLAYILPRRANEWFQILNGIRSALIINITLMPNVLLGLADVQQPITCDWKNSV